MAPGAGLEPATSKLTASCSTIELPGNRNVGLLYTVFFEISRVIWASLIIFKVCGKMEGVVLGFPVLDLRREDYKKVGYKK